MTQYKGYYNRAGAMSSYEATPEGGLLIHGVVIMAAGTWTDMHGITTTFSEEVLQRCAQNWDDPAVWTRHAGGTPRPVTDKVGAVRNPTYSPTEQAVVGDVYLHCQTDASRACAALVQMDRGAGGIKDVSAETMVEIDAQGNVLDVLFTGLALVEDGACETCRLPAYSVKEDQNMADEEKKKTPEEGGEGEGEGKAPVKDDADLLELLASFVSGLIPDTKDLIKGVMESEGDDRIRALGKLEGCMGAYGFNTGSMDAEAYSKLLDEKLTAFSKAEDERIAKLQESIAQFSTPSGLKGHAGAEKNVKEKPQTVTFYGGHGALY